MLTEALATFVVETSYEHLPEEATERAKTHILDCIGVMLAGSRHEVGKHIIQFVKTAGGNPQSSVITGGFKTSAPNAALANGTMGHALDYDDDSDSIIGHPTTVILPAILALGENLASGKDVLTSYVIGVEVGARIASVPGFMPGHYEGGWHATSTIGIMGAVAASAKILKLDIEQTKIAFGIAASEASGLKSNFGTMVKPLHAGSAAKKGVTAALLAKSGFVANPEMFESQCGYFDLYGGGEEYDFKKATENLGKSFDIIFPGINIKKYPSCYYTQSPIDALLALVKEHKLLPHNVRHIRCGVNEIAAKTLIYPDPRTGLEGKFSLPYCLTVALVNGDVTIKDFQDESVQDDAIQEMLKKIEMYSPPELKRSETKCSTVVEIETEDGNKYSHQLERPSGHGLSPLSLEELLSKFRACASFVLNENDTDFVISSIERLDEVSQVRELIEVLS